MPKKTSSIRPVVSIQYRSVTDRQTDRQTQDDSKYRTSIASRGKILPRNVQIFGGHSVTSGD